MRNLKEISIDKVKSLIYKLLGVFVIILVWYSLSKVYNNSMIVPSVSSVIKSLGEIITNSRFIKIVISTITRLMIIMIVSLTIAVILSYFSYKVKRIKDLISPLVVFLKSMPVVSIIVLLFLTIGVRYSPYITTLFVIMPIMYEGILNAIEQVDKNIIDDVKTLSNINIRIIISFYLPMIKNYIVTVLMQTLGLGFKVLIMSEYISPSNNTFGSEIRRYYNNNSMEEVVALSIIVLLIVLLLEGILRIYKKSREDE